MVTTQEKWEFIIYYMEFIQEQGINSSKLKTGWMTMECEGRGIQGYMVGRPGKTV